MRFALTSLASAMLITTAPLLGVAHAQATKGSATSSGKSAAAKAPIATKAPEDLILYDDATYAPVVDDVSRHLDAARKAFDAKDTNKAAKEMRAVADELKRQAARAGADGALMVKSDKALLAADTTYAQDTIKRMNASALTVSAAAASIESGKIRTKAEMDKAIDRAVRADMDRRWLITDVRTWYPVTEEPQRYFTRAVTSFARKDYKAAASDIRKAVSFVRLESNRATGEPKEALDRSVAQLEALATSVEKEAVKDEQSMAKVFASADHALALEYRAKAAESWTRKDYDAAGYDLKAAAFGLESAGAWTVAEAKAGGSTVVRNTRALGDKLAAGGTWTREEIAKGFESLGKSLDELGQRLGVPSNASPFVPGF